MVRHVLAMAVGVLKGVPNGGAALDEPGPWAELVLGQFAANDPSAVPKFLHVWETTPPRPPKSRWIYPITWLEPEGEMRFIAIVSTASEPDGLSFNYWMPADATSHAVVARVLEARGAKRSASGGTGRHRASQQDQSSDRPEAASQRRAEG